MSDAPNAGQAEWPDGWLVPVLVQAGLLTPVDLPRLRETGAPSAWQACVQASVASDEWILAAVAERFRVKIADLEAVPASAASLMPPELALRLHVVPLALDARGLDAACARPADPDLERTLSFGVGKRVHLQLASPGAIEKALARLYPAGLEEGARGARTDRGDRGDGPTRELEEVLAVTDPPILELVEALIARGVRLGASDLHLEPSAQALVARYRVDGVLREVGRVPRTAAVLLLNRLKTMANLEVADRMRPQDGRARAMVNGRKVDLRISSLPISGLGEKIVVRILDTGPTVLRLDALGFNDAELNGLGELLRAREGLVLVTGPTASGKTTTLYAALRQLQSGKVNVVSIEDPIEFRLEGISQVQVNHKAGLTFAKTLESVVRQDPDVILVGDLPDRATADMAVKAALTGHLVLSTVRAQDAATAVVSLADLGVDVAALARALRGVVAQRLIRRVCSSCSTPLTLEQLPAAQQGLLAGVEITQLCGAIGCPECGGTGYRGRVAVAEVAVLDTAAQRAIAQRAPVDELSAACRRAGMRSLWESGLSRVAAGVTTMHELLDNVAAPPAPATPAAAPANPAEGSLRQEDIDALVQRMLREREAAGGSAGGAAPAFAPAESAPAGPPEAESLGAEVAPADADIIAPADSPRPPAAAKPRVLLVDDHAEARRALREGLVAEGMRVLEAADGDTALEYMKRIKPDIVVLELALPRTDGFGILRAVTEGLVPRVPCVVLTVQDDPDVATWASELGASDYLVKPLAARALAARLRSRLGVTAG